ncbi:MAG: DUF3179 domain-containing protein [Thermoanaerobaculia bacterium]
MLAEGPARGAVKSQLFVPLAFLLATALVAAEPLDANRARSLLTRLLSAEDAGRATARLALLKSKDRSLIPALMDALFFAAPEARPDVVACLEGLSGERLGARYYSWFEYVGGHEEIRPAVWYRQWKAGLFARIDPAFARFLDPSAPLTIRPEEIVWGGVKRDGIPALKSPKYVAAAEATFLTDSETVFGVGWKGEFRAYPQRILDWHEMANDTLSGEPFALSYCTLCGSAIAYGTRLPDGRVLHFGSSGLLYRSNKLMYDEETFSLWSNLTGEPVAGALVGKGIVLAVLPLTVTSWKEWRRSHPLTTVVSLQTGYRRDYTPGALYGRYFSSPDTMFPVWKKDPSLEPKAWVYGLRRGAAAKAYPLEILFRERVVNDAVAGENVVLVADPEAGSVRAYARQSRILAEGPSPRKLIEPATGALWRIEEEALLPETPGLPALERLAGNRAYWFGWYAFFPETEVYEGCVPGSEDGRR